MSSAHGPPPRRPACSEGTSVPGLAPPSRGCSRRGSAHVCTETVSASSLSSAQVPKPADGTARKGLAAVPRSPARSQALPGALPAFSVPKEESAMADATPKSRRLPARTHRSSSLPDGRPRPPCPVICLRGGPGLRDTALSCPKGDRGGVPEHRLCPSAPSLAGRSPQSGATRKGTPSLPASSKGSCSLGMGLPPCPPRRPHGPVFTG